jgi:hypothetical protein
MNSNQIHNLILEMCLVLNNGYPIKLDAKYKVSAKGVPYGQIDDYTFCYFGKGKFFRVFKGHKGILDIKSRNNVISFFKNGKYLLEDTNEK